MYTSSATASPKPGIKKTKDNTHWKVFFLAFGVAFAFFLPFLIIDKGYFIYSGDFNVQQIPFYQLAHRAVRSGDIFWNWKTDLGVNFIGSYSFYLLFSPFFWLTLPFPTAVLPYLMAPLLMLKTACAALTSYLYLRRFVRNKNYAALGALLYAFSGWMSFNIFFNHFHDVAVFFPLLLLAVEKRITEDRFGWVAGMVALNAMVNYWFFIGEVVFVILYVIVRTYGKGWRITWRKFFWLALEAVLGVLGAAIVLLPSVLTLMGNPRTGTDRLISGWAFWLYGHGSNRDSIYPQRLPAILQSLFFPPDPPANPNFFPDHGAKWASLSAWLPLFGMTGVFAYFNMKNTRKDWLRKILGISLFIALIPGLNSLFVLLNNSYYARWFYMPILLMALATARAVEGSAADQESFYAGLKWTLMISCIFMIAIGLTPQKVDGEWKIGLAKYVGQAWLWFAVVLVGLLLLGILFFRFRQHPKFQRYLCGALVFIIVGFNVIYIARVQISSPRRERFKETALEGRYTMGLPEPEPFARSDIYDDTDNLLMFWDIPNIQAFHSVVPVSILEFYPSVGVTRDVGSRPGPEYYALRSLLSVRWLFIDKEKDQNPMPGYTYVETQMDYNVYENEAYLPMGFTYDYYVSPETFESVFADERGNLLLRAVHLEEEALQRHQDILEPLPAEQVDLYSVDQYVIDAAARKENTATEFVIDTRGFQAKTSFDTEELVFFSVPYEGGWSATVNGISVPIEKANVGFMAVRVPAGAAEIRFDYMTPGLIPGAIITLVVGIGFGIWWYMSRKKRSIRRSELQEEQKNAENLSLCWDDYLNRYTPQQRKKISRGTVIDDRTAAIDYESPDIRKLLSLSQEETVHRITKAEAFPSPPQIIKGKIIDGKIVFPKAPIDPKETSDSTPEKREISEETKQGQ